MTESRLSTIIKLSYEIYTKQMELSKTIEELKLLKHVKEKATTRILKRIGIDLTKTIEATNEEIERLKEKITKEKKRLSTILEQED